MCVPRRFYGKVRESTVPSSSVITPGVSESQNLYLDMQFACELGGISFAYDVSLP
jgi:hypothetical protein